MQPISLAALHPALAARWIQFPLVRHTVEKLLSLPEGNRLIHKLFTGYPPEVLASRLFPCAAETFGVRYAAEGRENIPKTGPVIAVANHPKGIVDGLALGALLQEARPDAKLVANAKLASTPQVARAVIPVDLAAPGGNASALRGMLRQLNAGGAIGVFPAGAISTFSIRERRVRDDAWTKSIAALVEKTGATVVPVHFAGSNSWLFHAVSMISHRLRGLLYFHELARDRRRRVPPLRIRIGAPVAAEELGGFPDRGTATRYLRERTLASAF